MKFKVTFFLMIDPNKGDHTFKHSYMVEAQSESEALKKAEELKEEEESNISKRCVFDYKIKKQDEV